ncbi:ADAMTS-like protein 4 isoform X2 [Amia ocellicauda]|uniref:ADAMTS-like protein 4 isoform X2 n=1 Tax=Amia ocellicauda TaxID=2972642 RepID=UPI0034642965
MGRSPGSSAGRLCMFSVIFSLCVSEPTSPARIKGCSVINPALTALQVPGRVSRQAGGSLDGVWGPWGAWSPCSRSCGFGVSERKRRCLPPPEYPPIISALRPDYTPLRDPHYSPRDPHYAPRDPSPREIPFPPPPANQSPGLPLYRPSRDPDPLLQPPLANQEPPFYRSDYPPTNQDFVSIYRQPFSSSSSSSPQGYGQSGRDTRRPTNQGAVREGGGSGRRSIPTNHESRSSRRSPIRPGQFGYGRVPFSLPLHRPHRRARHSTHVAGGNSTLAPSAALTEEEEGGAGKAGDTGEEGEMRTESGVTSAERRGRGREVERAGEEEGGSRRESEGERGGGEEEEGTVEGEGRRGGETEVEERGGDGAERERPASPPHTDHRAPPPQTPYTARRARPPPRPQPRPERDPLNRFLLHPSPPHSPHTWLFQPHGPPPAPEREREPEDRAARGGPWMPYQPPHSCPGKETEHRACSSECPGGDVDPRVEQCSEYNTVEFMGKHYTWEPFSEGAAGQCELACRPVGLRFYVRQSVSVRDGAPCPGPGVCLGGQCLSVGCDEVVGSGLVIDDCGRCGGGGTSCRRVTGSFTNSSIAPGYHRFLDIPAGATRVNITERQPGASYLALRGGGGQPVVNGRWAVDPPGQYEGGGTLWEYRRPGTGGGGESLTAPGPTSTVLHAYIIFHKDNPGIDYEFLVPVERQPPPQREISALALAVPQEPWRPPPREGRVMGALGESRNRPRGSAPNRNVRIPPRTDLPLDTQPDFLWRKAGLTECSASCGKGVQVRLYQCVSRKTEEEVADRKCDAATKPLPIEEPCNIQACPPFWDVGDWSECSVSCGPGVQHRQVQCRQSFSDLSTMVLPQRCARLPRPLPTQPCQLRLCAHWEVHSNWSECSVQCGAGVRSRTVRCVGGQGAAVSERECSGRPPPADSQPCHMGPCVHSWYHTEWSNMCSVPCGPGVQRRSVVCLSSGGGEGPGGGQSCRGAQPANMRACSGGVCQPSTHWYTGAWSECSAECGNGTQRRDVICVLRSGTDLNVTQPGECVRHERPSPVQSCTNGPCLPRWYTTDWSACSQSCQGGVQVREVRCLTEDKHLSRDCESSTRPPEQQTCNQQPCTAQLDENCRDRRHNCALVVQARLCVYTYYQTACCASCSRTPQRTRRHSLASHTLRTHQRHTKDTPSQGTPELQNHPHPPTVDQSPTKT